MGSLSLALFVHSAKDFHLTRGSEAAPRLLSMLCRYWIPRASNISIDGSRCRRQGPRVSQSALSTCISHLPVADEEGRIRVLRLSPISTLAFDLQVLRIHSSDNNEHPSSALHVTSTSSVLEYNLTSTSACPQYLFNGTW
jgi:hypothetical protein